MSTNASRSKPLTQLIDCYETCNRSEGKSPKTVHWYSANLRHFLSYLHSRHHSEEIDGIDIKTLREYVLYLQTRKRFQGSAFTPPQGLLASASVHGHVRTIRAFYSWLAREELISTNVAKGLKPPKILRKTTVTLSDEEIRSIMATFDPRSPIGQRDQTIFMLLFDTGIRVGELISLRIENLRLNEGFMKVTGKGNKERLVPVGANAQKALHRYMFRFRQNPESQQPTHVFLTVSGFAMTENTLRLMFDRLALRSGVGRLHPHLLRHTFATRYLINGGNVFTLQSILGHSTLDMVKNYVSLASTHVAYEH